MAKNERQQEGVEQFDASPKRDGRDSFVALTMPNKGTRPVVA